MGQRLNDCRPAENAAIAAEFKAGKSVAEIAAARGWRLSGVCIRLQHAGCLTRPLPEMLKARAYG